MSSTTQSIILFTSTVLVLAGLAVDSADGDTGAEGPSAFVATPSVAPLAVDAPRTAPTAVEAEPMAERVEGEELLYSCEGPVG